MTTHEDRRVIRHRLISVLIIILSVLSAIGPARAAPTTEWLLQGKVFAGDVGDESTARSGVTVAVYGASASYPTQGTLIRSTTTDSNGWYGLTVWDDDGVYDTYYLLETDPAGYLSVGATSVSGTVHEANWIAFAAPLTGQDLTGNKFWDRLPVLSGRVYAGTPPDETNPLADVTVALYCAQNVGELGTRIDETTTDGEGWYGLTASPGCEVYTLVETDPEGYVSTGATTVGGDVLDDNTIRYQVPLAGKTRTGNKFWDEPEVTPQPDLVVADLWGEGSALCFHVRNRGSDTAPAGHTAAVHVDGVEADTATIAEALAPEEGIDACVPWSCSGVEDEVEVTADATGLVAEQDEGNNTRQEWLPCDATPPVIIDGPHVDDLSPTSARIWWETDEPSDSLVRYGPYARRFAGEVQDGTLDTWHEVTLDALQPATTYHYEVASTDGQGNEAEAEGAPFETQPEPDAVDPTVELAEIGECAGTITVTASASDNAEVERVEFYLDGERFFTDYDPPYEAELDTVRLDNGEAGVQVRVVDTSGRESWHERPMVVANFIDVEAPTVDIYHPYDGETVYGDYKVYATVSDDSGWGMVEWFVDGVKFGGGSFPLAPSLDLSFWWDTKFYANGSYLLGVRATDKDGKEGYDTVPVTINNAQPLPAPKLEVTNHEVYRHGSTFAIELTVKNKGQATAYQVKAEDTMTAFQPISRTFNGVSYGTDLALSSLEASCTLADPFSLAPGDSQTYTCIAVPVMIHDPGMEPNPPVPSVGDAITLSYRSQYGAAYLHSAPFAVMKTTADPGQTASEPLATAHANALKASRYLIVTNPNALSTSNPFQAISPVLSNMAELAFERGGVLGYLGTSNRNTFDGLIEPNGTWAKQLHADFRSTAKGYLLIVGETEIIPAWRVTGWSITWSNSTCTTREVDNSDLPYADTAGNTRSAPELIVGRIIGNNLTDLARSLRAGIDGSIDRSHALLISGTDGNAAIQAAFVNSVTETAQIMGSEFNVTELHFKDIATAQRVPQVRNNTSGKDVMVYMGHGAPDGWGDLSTDDIDGDPSAIPPIAPLSFGTPSPLVAAFSCLTGSYEDHTANAPCTHDGGDDNVAEAFIDSGAGVYIGATEVSEVYRNGIAMEAFFDSYWTPNTPAGEALTRLKRDKWNASDGYWTLWVVEYNLYGDPMYGAVPSQATAAFEPTGAGTTREAPSTLVIDVPDVVVTSLAGYDQVTLPGGSVHLEAGEVRVPTYGLTQDYPAGLKVQEVEMVVRSDRTTMSGLTLPIHENAQASRPLGPSPSAAATSGWYPEERFRWYTMENPDGSATLFVEITPFVYNTLTAEADFYQHYEFRVISTTTAISLTEANAGQAVYPKDAQVTFEIEVVNAGDPTDARVDAVVKRYATDEVVDTLLLETLSGLEGAASFSPRWDSAGAEPGYYVLEVTLLSAEGWTLDRESALFRVGIHAAEITAFEASPGSFDPGDGVDASMTIENAGEVPLSGQAVIEVWDAGGTRIETFTHSVHALNPGATLTLDDTWDTTGVARGTYALRGTLSYDGTTLGTEAVSASSWHQVYLPVVLMGN